VSVSEAASALGVSAQLVRKLIARGLLRARRRYRCWKLWRDRYRLEIRIKALRQVMFNPEALVLIGEEREKGRMG